jgi:hypothetical protein
MAIANSSPGEVGSLGFELIHRDPSKWLRARWRDFPLRTILVLQNL